MGNNISRSTLQQGFLKFACPVHPFWLIVVHQLQCALRGDNPCRGETPHLPTEPRARARRALQAAQAAATVAAEYAQSLQRGAPEPPPVVLRKLFERLGSTYIKLGQFIASR